MTDPTTFAPWVALSVTGASAGAWVAYFRWKDKIRPEPRWMVALGVVGGALAVGAAILGYGTLESFGGTVDWSSLTDDEPARAAMSALIIGAIEESAKVLPVALIARFSSHFDEHLDGLVYAAFAAIGFSAVEAIAIYASGIVAGIDVLARALVAPITHALLAAPAGYGVSLWVLDRRPLALFAGVAVSIVLHAAYDLCLARPGLQLAAAAIMLLVWIWMMIVARRLAR